MPLNIVAPPYPVFTDRDGTPLENGYVYLGEPGFDAETNPIAVFWDESLTIPAAQPIRTVYGYLSRSGTPAKLYANRTFSITVKNVKQEVVFSSLSNVVSDPTAGRVDVEKFTGDGTTTQFTMTAPPLGENNTQVYINGVYQSKDGYSLSGAILTFSEAPPAVGSNIEVVSIENLVIGEADASNVQYLPSAGVATTVQAKLRETVSVKDFGAVGDGITDDTAAFAAAFASGAKSIICGNTETYKINLVLSAPTSYTYTVLDLNGSTLTSDTGTIFELQRYANFTIQNGIFDGQEGAADYGLKVGYGTASGVSSSGLVLKNLRFNAFGQSCVHSLNASYTLANSCIFYNYFGDALSGAWFTFLDVNGRYVGFTNCVSMTGSAIGNFIHTHFFCETNVTPETLVKLTDCAHFEFNDCTFEPQNTCTVAQVLITSDADFSSDIHFTNCYWLGEINAARQADSIRTTGTVHRLRLNKNNFYIVDGGLGFYNLKISSTGQAFEIWDCYVTSQYNDATRANMTILNSTSQEIYRQNLGALFLGDGGSLKGLFVNKNDGSLLNAGQLYYDDEWQVVSGGVGTCRIIPNAVTPFSDGAQSLGNSTLSWSAAYAVDIRPGDGTRIWTAGLGSPEGVVTAPVGSMYTRTDGSTGTTLYVKESGAGNTGWVAK